MRSIKRLLVTALIFLLSSFALLQAETYEVKVTGAEVFSNDKAITYGFVMEARDGKKIFAVTMIMTLSTAKAAVADFFLDGKHYDLTEGVKLSDLESALNNGKWWSVDLDVLKSKGMMFDKYPYYALQGIFTFTTVIDEIPLTINTVPAGADIYVNGQLKGVSPITIKAPIDATITAKKEGYDDQTKKLDLKNQKEATLDIPMGEYDMDPRVITIKTSPTTGAKIFANGKEIGESGIQYTVNGKKRGLKLRAEKNGISIEKTIDIVDKGNSSVTIDFDAEPRTIKLESFPSLSAKVKLAGKDVGTTPCVVTVYGPQKCEFTAEANGISAKVSLGVENGGSFNGKFDLDAEPRIISITSSPTKKADVYVGGKKVGVTPCDITAYGKGPLEVTLQKNGLKKVVSLSTPEIKAYKVDVSFDAEPRTLIFQVEPKDAKVTVNGSRVDASDGEAVFYESKLNVKIEKSGYVSYETSVKLGPNETETITATLQPDYAARAANIVYSGLDLGVSWSLYPDDNLLGFDLQNVIGLSVFSDLMIDDSWGFYYGLSYYGLSGQKSLTFPSGRKYTNFTLLSVPFGIIAHVNVLGFIDIFGRVGCVLGSGTEEWVNTSGSSSTRTKDYFDFGLQFALGTRFYLSDTFALTFEATYDMYFEDLKPFSNITIHGGISFGI